MREFLAALDAVFSCCERAGAGESGAPGAARAALAALRGCYPRLAAEERAAALPLAQLAAQRVAGLAPAATVAQQVAGLAPAATAARQVAAPAPAAVPARVFEGEPTPEALLRFFGYTEFRSGQREAVQAALAHRDSLVIMPTGGGKSLCYQLPGVAGSELTVVVTPLIALMRDQCQRLTRDGHPAVMLASGLPEAELQAALQAIRDGGARIAFCAPERFGSLAFVEALSQRPVGLFVVDEAHCIAQWGHDFRPDYLRLDQALQRLGRPPVMALTATATAAVAAEIVQRLRLRDPLVVQGGFDRPNISFDVITVQGKGAVAHKRALLRAGLSAAENLPAIVYTGTRKDTEDVAADLRAVGLDAVHYHAGLEPELRSEAQARFMSGACQVIVATNAFGMGIDKLDIRSVWHWALPTSLEALYQEAGRAGRDGRPARAVLLAMRADLGRLINFNNRRSVSADAVEICLTQLRERAAGAANVTVEFTDDETQRICLAIAERAGAVRLAPGTGGGLSVELLGTLDRNAAQRACEQARDRGWQAYRSIERYSASHERCRRRQLLEHFGDSREPRADGRCCDICDPIDWLPEPLPETGGAGAANAGRRARPMPAAAPLAGADQPLYDALVNWRREAADGKPAYVVASNATLAAITGAKPVSAEQLAAIHGVGPHFLEFHGEQVLELVAAHTSAV